MRTSDSRASRWLSECSVGRERQFAGSGDPGDHHYFGMICRMRERRLGSKYPIGKKKSNQRGKNFSVSAFIVFLVASSYFPVFSNTQTPITVIKIPIIVIIPPKDLAIIESRSDGGHFISNMAFSMF
jgi:hypothetical protein